MDPDALRHARVDELKKRGSIRTPMVEAAFSAVPRHLFVPQVSIEEAYAEKAIVTKTVPGGAPISSCSQPAIVAIMLEQLDLRPGHRVLEIGAGTGYNVALMAHIVGDTGRVTTIDIDEDIVQGARDHLAAAGFDQVEVICGDGGLGHTAGAPYDRIILTVQSPDITPAWFEQLKVGGRMVMPLPVFGIQRWQWSVAFERQSDHLLRREHTWCGFMPLRGEFAESPEAVRLPGESYIGIITDERKRADADAVHKLLTGPHADHEPGLEVKWAYATGLLSWIARNDPRICIVSGDQKAADGEHIPRVGGSCWSVGLLEGDSLCLVGDQTPAEVFEKEPAETVRPVVRGFGADRLAEQVKQHIQNWHAAGQPKGEKNLRLRVYPVQAPHLPQPGEFCTRRRWMQCVFDWPDPPPRPSRPHA